MQQDSKKARKGGSARGNARTPMTRRRFEPSTTRGEGLAGALTQRGEASGRKELIQDVEAHISSAASSRPGGAAAPVAGQRRGHSSLSACTELLGRLILEREVLMMASAGPEAPSSADPGGPDRAARPCFLFERLVLIGSLLGSRSSEATAPKAAFLFERLVLTALVAPGLSGSATHGVVVASGCPEASLTRPGTVAAVCA